MKHFLNHIVLAAVFLALGANLHSQAPKVLWARQIGSSTVQGEYASGFDRAGNCYFAGTFSAPYVTVGNQTLTNSSPAPILYLSQDIFLARYDSQGNLLWVRQVGVNGDGVPLDCATDDSGNVFITGIFGANLMFGVTTLTNAGQYDVFIAKFDPQGNVLWARQAGGGGYDSPYHLAVDHEGNAFLAGSFNSTNFVCGTNEFSYSPSSPQNSSSDDFLIKYSPAGDALWARQIRVHDFDIPTLAVDGAGNVRFAGQFYQTADFGSLTVIDTGNPSVPYQTTSLFLAEYDSSGNLIWARQAGWACTPEAMISDSQGVTYVAGSCGNLSTIDSAPIPINAGSFVFQFIARFDPLGHRVWADSIGSINPQLSVVDISQVRLDQAGNCYLTGRLDFTGDLRFNGVALTNFPLSSSNCCLVAKCSANGDFLWSRIFFAPGTAYNVNATLVDPWGSVSFSGLCGARTAGAFSLDAFQLNLSPQTFAYYVARLEGPQLNFKPVGPQLQLSWPTNAPGLSLDTATSLNGPWLPLTNSPSISGDQNTINVDTTAPSQFFRFH